MTTIEIILIINYILAFKLLIKFSNDNWYQKLWELNMENPLYKNYDLNPTKIRHITCVFCLIPFVALGGHLYTLIKKLK